MAGDYRLVTRHTHPPPSFVLREAICYPRGIYHNITLPSKLFIWRSSGNKKHLLSYRLYPHCPSSSGSTWLTLCSVCVCAHACVCIQVCPLSYSNSCLTFPVGEIHYFDIPWVFCGNWNVLLEPRGNFSKALNGKILLNVCAAVFVCMFLCLLFAVKGQFLWDDRSQTYTCLLSSVLCSHPSRLAVIPHALRRNEWNHCMLYYF